MFNVELHAGPQIDVAYRKHSFNYAVDGSLPNPLEAFYGSLAGCAGVFAKKSCAEQGLSDEGIAIRLRPVVKPDSLLLPDKLVTTIRFPAGFPPEARTRVINAVSRCAVKEVVRRGADIEFSVVEAQ
jgi:uncharacterized OsmC-like protein